MAVIAPFTIPRDDRFDDTPPSPFAVPQQTRPPERRKVLRLSPERREALLKQLQEHYDEAKAPMQEAAAKRALRYRRYLADAALRDGLQPW